MFIANPCYANSFKQAEINKTVLYDENNVKITANKLEYKNNDPILSFTFENDTDKTLSFITGSLGYDRNAINGYMMSGAFANEKVSPGMSLNQDVEFRSTELSEYGIDEIGQIIMDFEICDEDNNDYALTGPLVLDTSLKDSYDPQNDTYRKVIQNPSVVSELGNAMIKKYAEKEIYNSSGIVISSEALAISGNQNEPWIILEVENHSESIVNFNLNDISVNGLLVVNGLWSRSVIHSGCRSIVSLSTSDILTNVDTNLLELTELLNLGFNVDLVDDNNNNLAETVPLNIDLSDDFPKLLKSDEIQYKNNGTELYNCNGIRVIYKGLTRNNYNDFSATFVVENNTQLNIGVTMDDNAVLINGSITADTNYFTNFIEAGKTELLNVSIAEDTLSSSGITDTSQILTLKLQFQLVNYHYENIGEICADIKIR